MNIEDLSKTQLLLLTLLVNFVTSIATGVLTVSLLDQAPPTVIQTVNRIVDHTIETVATEVPVIRNVTSQAPSTEDLLTAAIAEVSGRSVRVYRAGNDDPIAFGTYLPSARSVFAPAALPGTVTIEFANGTRLVAEAAAEGSGMKRYAFAEDASMPAAPAGRLVLMSELKAGQTAIALSSDEAVVTGIITRLGDELQTDLPGIPEGAAAVNFSGDIIGISLGDGRLVTGEQLAALLPS